MQVHSRAAQKAEKPKRVNRNGPVEESSVNIRALRTARQIADTTGGKVRIIRWGKIEVW